jgi:TolB-like protein/DNA-binding winged helix-turn-helix (wHTH) protein/Tfp pilus assembly protein PilF
MSTLAQGFWLDALRVDPSTGDLTGPAGCERLDPKVVCVLVMLAEHPGQVVSREALLSRAWPGVVVSDDALTRCLYELRRQLAAAGGDEALRALVETLPKRGYRLNATVRPLGAVPDQSPEASQPQAPRGGSRRAAIVAGMLLAVLGVGVYLWLSPEKANGPATPPAPRAIAVLPFLDMSPEQDQRYFSDGVTEQILDRLSQSKSLSVISRTSSFALRDQNLDVPQIASHLDVDYVLEGSVRKSGANVRITAQLIDASTNLHVWSKTFDGTLDDLFTLQDEIAGGVASALHATIGAGPPGERETASFEAYDRFLQGQFLYNRRAPGDVERAAAYFREAVALDPRYSRAWASLAGVYALLIGEIDEADAKSLRNLQSEAALKAVELDPGLAVAHARLAQYYYHVREREKGDEHMRRAHALGPDDLLVLGFSASDALWSGDTPEATRLWSRIVARDPLSATNRMNYGTMLLLNGQPREAEFEFRRVFELNPASDAEALLNLVKAMVLSGREADASKVVERLPAGMLRDAGEALLLRNPAMSARAKAALERLRGVPRDTQGTILLAEALAFQGRHEEAFAVLREANERVQKDEANLPRMAWYLRDEMRLAPLLKPLHADPRWAALTSPPD